MLTPFSIPRTDGIPAGRYRLLLGARTEDFFGVRYVSGASVESVGGRTIMRQWSAFGDALRLEPWDVETAERCLTHAQTIERPDLVQALTAWLAERAEPASTETGEGEAGDGLGEASVEALRELATSLGLAPGNKQEKALIKLIRAERAKQPPASTETGEG